MNNIVRDKVISILNLDEVEKRKIESHLRRKLKPSIYFKVSLTNNEESLYQKISYGEFELQAVMVTDCTSKFYFNLETKYSYEYSDSTTLSSWSTLVEIPTSSLEIAINEFNEVCELLLFIEKMKKDNLPSNFYIKYKNSQGESEYARISQLKGRTNLTKIRMSINQRKYIDFLGLESKDLKFLDYDYDESLVSETGYSEFGDKNKIFVTYDSNFVEIYEKDSKIVSSKSTDEEFIEICQIVKYLNSDDYSYSKSVETRKFSGKK